VKKQNQIHKILRNAGLGKIKYQLFHRPISALKSLNRIGLTNSIYNAAGKSDMIQAARKLYSQKSLPKAKSTVPICILTGKKYWYQTIFCLHSLQHFSEQRFSIEIFSDGSLEHYNLDLMQEKLGELKYVSNKKMQMRIENLFNEHEYQTLLNRRKEYPHLRKLTDIHAGRKGWHLVLDSDMLFFDRPTELLDWMHNPQKPLCMKDCVNSYGYSSSLLTRLAKDSVPSLINVGITGLKSDEIEWPQIQEWIQKFQEAEGTSYFQEQALVALLLSGKDFLQLDGEQYRCINQSYEGTNCKLIHFVSDSKSFYFQKAWQKYLSMTHES